MYNSMIFITLTSTLVLKIENKNENQKENKNEKENKKKVKSTTFSFDNRVFSFQIDDSWNWSVICTSSTNVREYIISSLVVHYYIKYLDELFLSILQFSLIYSI